MASFRRRGGRWQARIQRRGHPDQTRTFQTRADAVLWSRAVERALDTGDLGLAKAPLGTLGTLLERYRMEVSPTKRGGTQEVIRLLAMSRRDIAKCPTSRLTANEVAAYR